MVLSDDVRRFELVFGCSQKRVCAYFVNGLARYEPSLVAERVAAAFTYAGKLVS